MELLTSNAADRLERSIPVRESVDILVAGGGPAGLAAAVVAARQGARVLLVESQGCLGGMGTAGLLPIFMPFGDDTHFYAGGFGREVYDRMEAEEATLSERPWGPRGPVIRVEPLKRIYDDLATKAEVRLLLVTHVSGVERRGDRVTHVVCASKSGLFAVAARMVVDATGDGDVCAWAGAPFEKGDADGALMGATLCSLWEGVDWSRGREAIGSAERTLKQVLQDDPRAIPNGDPHLPGIVRLGGSVGGGNVSHCYGVDGTDERSLTQAFLEARSLLPHYERFYRERLPGYENMQLLSTGSLMGVRETRRIVGDYVLCIEDFHRRATFEDEIGRFNYWIDTHLSKPSATAFAAHCSLRAENARLKDGESYGIPYRTLTPQGLSNVLVAGRCISADRAVLSSVRVMPGCFITGQAAGLAAAMALDSGENSRGVDIAQLRQRLRALGAFLP